MKKRAALTLVLLFICSTASAAKITSIDFDHDRMKEKAKRGSINIVSSPMEIVKQAKIEYENAEDKKAVKVLAVVGGTFKGIAYGLGRLGSGLVDVLTFNLDLKEDYDPFMKPEYVYSNE